MKVIRHKDVVGVVTPEVVPVLMISAAENQLLMSAAAVVDGRQVVSYCAQVRELHVAFTDTLAAAWQHLQPTFQRYQCTHTLSCTVTL